MELDYTTSIVADDRQEAQPITKVWRNGGLSDKLKVSAFNSAKSQLH